MTRRRVVLFALILGIVGGAIAVYAWTSRTTTRGDVVRMLETAEPYELLSLDPMYGGPGPDGDAVILGRATITDRATRDGLNAALLTGLREGPGAKCFAPRHAIRLRDGGRASELVICFECRQVKLWRDGRQVARFTTSTTSQPTFDAVLRAAGVPLASDVTYPATKPATLPPR